MKIVLQRVSYGSVKVDKEITGEIAQGLVILFGVAKEDTTSDADFLADKCLNLRVFEDDNGKMNLSLLDIKGEVLIVSQFTLYGDTRKGRRPGFDQSAPPHIAEELYNYFVETMKKSGLNIQTGIFRANMEVTIHNDGPVTFIVSSEK